MAQIIYIGTKVEQAVPQDLHVVYAVALFITELEMYQPSLCLFTLSQKSPNFAGGSRNFSNVLFRLQNNSFVQQNPFLEEIYIALVRVSKGSVQPALGFMLALTSYTWEGGRVEDSNYSWTNIIN